MAEQTRQAPDPQWKQLLHLGEQLTSQLTPTAQCALISSTIAQLMPAEAQMWLASPAYPLPGSLVFSSDQEADILPQTAATALVHCAFQERHTCYPAQINTDSEPPSRKGRVSVIAIPLIANENLLGVVQIAARPGRSLSARDISRLEGLLSHAAIAMEITRQEALKNWRYEQINLVRLVSSQMANLRDPNALYPRITRLIQATFHYYYVAIFTLDERRNRFIFRASSSQLPTAHIPDGYSAAPGEGFIGAVGLTGSEIVSPDVRQDSRYRFLDSLPGTLSEAAFPIKVENQLLGVLDVQSDQLNAFHDIDLLVLHALADNIALAMESTQLYNDLHHRAEQISSVFEVSHALASLLDMDELLNEVVRLIQKRFGFPFVHVFSVHPGRRRVIYQAGSGERSEAMRHSGLSYPLDMPEGLIPWVARTGETRLANDVTLDPLYVPSDLPPYDTRAELTVPLKAGQEVMGILDIQSDQVNAFDENDRSLFEALAVTIASAMRNATVYRSEQWRRQVAESFRDVAYLVSTNQPLDQLLATVLQKLETNLPCAASAIWLSEENGTPLNNGPDSQRLRLAAVSKIAPEKVVAAQQEMEVSGMLARALASDQPVIRGPQDPYGPLGLALNFDPNYSSIAAPMRTGGQSLGIVALVHPQDGRYGSEALAITATFASYAAVAIQNARLYRESQEQALISTMLLQVAEASQTTQTVDDLLNTMLRLARLLIGVRKCAFLLWEDSLQSFQLKAWYGFEPTGSEAPYLFSAHLPALARLATERTTLYSDTPAEDLHLAELSLSPEPGTVVVLPLLVRSELAGAFLVTLQLGVPQGEGQQAFDPKAISILQGIAHQTALTVDNLRLLEARQEEAYVTAALLQVAQAVVSSTDLHDTLDTIVHLLPILVGIDSSVIYLWDPVNQLFRPAQVYAGSRRDEEALASHSYPLGEYPLLDNVWKSGDLYLCPMPDPRIPPSEWIGLECQPYKDLANAASSPLGDWLLAYPLTLQGMVMGILLVREKNTSPVFWEKRLEMIHGIAQQVSMVIQNDLFKQEMVKNERMDREIQLARQIQETFLPNSLPRLEGWELDLRWETAREVGGDFYDIFMLDDNRLGMVIADVSDKGMPAALYMTVARTLIRAYAASGNSPARVLEEVNDLLVNDSPESMFITVVYAMLDLQHGQLTYANAGHNRPLLYRQTTHQVEQLPKGGLAMGILKEQELVDHTIDIASGDVLILFTDGVTDILSPQTESFGDERLRLVIEHNGQEDVETILENLDDALSDFRQGTRQFDDITLVALRRLPYETV